MGGEPILEMLANFGAFGMALAVIGGAGWAVWKKVVEPQQKIARQATEKHITTFEKHIATLEKMIEEFGKRNVKHSELEKEHLDALRKINGRGDLVSLKIESHDERMGREHDRLSGEIKAK